MQRFSRRTWALVLAVLLVLAVAVPIVIQIAALAEPAGFTGRVKLSSSSSKLNVRKGPGTSYTLLGSLKNGEEITVTGQSGSWYTITYRGSAGYVSAPYIQKVTASTTAAPKGQGTVQASSLNIRKGPGTGYGVLGKLALGASVTLTGQSGDWYTLSYKGAVGYVNAPYIRRESPAATAQPTTKPAATATASPEKGTAAHVTASSLNIRKGPGTGYGVLGKLARGSSVTTYEKTNGFYRIAFQNTTGYVSAEYIAQTVARADLKNLVIGIDAGHQKKANYDKEPVSPGSSEKKAKVSSGTQGVSTKLAEHEVNLAVALLLEKRLKDAGVTVIMTRTKADVDISNAKRATMMNDADCDLVIRIHCNGNENASLKGAFMLVPASKNTASIHTASTLAADTILKSFIGATGAKNLGITKRSDLTGFNWSTVPVCLIEMGHQSNKEEDKLLASAGYQEKCAQGLFNGVKAWWTGQ